MTGEPVPPEHSVVRYCKGSSLTDGMPGVGSFARRQNEAGLSVNELDGSDDPKAEVAAAKKLMSPWLSMGATGRLAVLPVKAILDVDAVPQMTVYREPQTDPANVRPANPRHCEIANVPTEADMQAGRTSVLLALAAAVTTHWKVSEL